MINVINFIDGVDGLAAGVCVISAATLAVIALSLDRNEAGVLAAITAGGALGFLRHGFPPASSFMGDTGSNLLGYLLAVDRDPGLAEDERRRRAVLPADRPRGADPRHGLRRRQAAQVPAADLPGRPLALPPPDGEHRLLAAAHARLPLRLDAGPGGAGAGAALRPLQRRPRQLRPALDGGDRLCFAARRARRQLLPGRTCSRSSSCAAPAAQRSRPRGACRRRGEVDEGVDARARDRELRGRNPRRGSSRGWTSRPASSTP